MLQVDHVYEFFHTILFKKYEVYTLPNGVIPLSMNIGDASFFHIFNYNNTTNKIFFHDQEPIIDQFIFAYLDVFNYPTVEEYQTVDNFINCLITKSARHRFENQSTISDYLYRQYVNNPRLLFKLPTSMVVSEKSKLVDTISIKYSLSILYYFFHGFAALDHYRGFYALNYNKQVIKDYTYDYITFNRLVSNDRSYRCYFVSLLYKHKLIKKGQVSFGINNERVTWEHELTNSHSKLSSKARVHMRKYLPRDKPLIIDGTDILGSASADIPRCINDSLWHIVTETVFYYDKLHLTEKIFKPIVMKQPFMLLGAVGNLAYLKSYGFKTFEGIIDESYDTIVDNDARTEAVVQQIAWYCALSAEEKRSVIEAIAPIVEYNFHHFYGEFKHIITRELLDNCKTLFKDIGYDDNAIAYDDIYKVLTT